MIAVAAAVMGVLMSLGYFSQAYKIFKRKSGQDVSILTFATLAIGTTVWLLYGIIINDIIVMLGFGLGVLGSISVLLLALKYRKK